MVVIKNVNAKSIKDSRGEETILVTINTDIGKFSASAPNGKSKGKHEAPSYKKDLQGDIKTLRQFDGYFSKDKIENFNDLRRIEDTVDKHIGANTLFALESTVLKAIAKEKRKEVWQIINPDARKFPRLVGNCIGGGLHSHGSKKPDFQEFVLVPETRTVKEGFESMKAAKKEAGWALKKQDEKFQEKKNDEDAWVTSLNEKEVLDILKESALPLGVDVAASSFHARKKYLYQNPVLNRSAEEQLFYLSNLIKNFSLFYIEDPFSEEDFESFAALLKKFPNSLIVGDDLTTTNIKRFQKAIDLRAINAIIVKPNQNGCLTEVKEICDIAKKHGIRIVFSHRSGETNETILADLAFGFQADFLKCGITGKEREVKIKRLIEIEKKMR